MRQTGFNKSKSKSKRRSLGDPQRRQLVALVEGLGQSVAAEKLGLSVQTVAVLAAGFRANGSTVELVERQLAEIEKASP